MSSPTPPSPARLFDTINAYQQTAVIKGAIELDLFTHIARKVNTPAALAQVCHANERGMRILCDYLVVHGFLTKANGQYGLTPDSAAFLDKQMPTYMGGVTEFLLSPTIAGSFNDVAAIVRNGGSIASDHGTVAPDHPVWVKFAKAMVPMMGLPALKLAELVLAGKTPAIKVLDIAAGHGLYGIAFAQLNPNARVVGLDWKNVAAVAREHAEQAKVGARYSTIEGSAFEVDYGTDYDVVLLPNFLHHFDAATCETLLKKVYAALKNGGCVATLEFIPDEDRVNPPIAATFAMMMLGTTPSGDAYTFAEYQRMFKAAGFARNEIHLLPPTFHRVVMSYK